MQKEIRWNFSSVYFSYVRGGNSSPQVPIFPCTVEMEIIVPSNLVIWPGFCISKLRKDVKIIESFYISVHFVFNLFISLQSITDKRKSAQSRVQLINTKWTLTWSSSRSRNTTLFTRPEAPIMNSPPFSS